MHSASSSDCQNAVHVVHRLIANPAPAHSSLPPPLGLSSPDPARHCTFQAVGLTSGFNSLVMEGLACQFGGNQ